MALCPVGRIHEHRNQGVETVVTLFTISLSDLLRVIVFLFPTILGSAGLELLLPKGSTLSQGHTERTPLNYKL